MVCANLDQQILRYTFNVGVEDDAYPIHDDADAIVTNKLHEIWRDKMQSPKSVKTLEEFGRVQLSKSFFMRDFLYSEISQIEKIPNIPDYPDTAIEAGRGLCENVLEPIQDALGRICVRSAYRSSAVNSKGAENNNQYSCSKNESNYAGHIWDVRDSNGHIGNSNHNGTWQDERYAR